MVATVLWINEHSKFLYQYEVVFLLSSRDSKYLPVKLGDINYASAEGHKKP